MDVINHYDLLIDEGNDPFRDPPVLQEYMSRWDGERFIEALELTGNKRVLEVGIGTGRLAGKVAPLCLSLTGIDISPKTIKRAKENLKEHKNISFICDDFNDYQFRGTFDVVYSSLTMMHFRDKKQIISKIDALLNKDGIFCLSIDKNRSEYIDMGIRKVRIYPDSPDNIKSLISATAMSVETVLETDNAYIIVSKK
ncbi:MAG: class I SAM-dependent methyltransferase [Clostridia bacterium]|nr:class I SAM-dependent methyltransferase [Clostridia bacterium]